MDIFTILVVIGIVLLALSGFFDLIEWQFNIPAIVVLVVIWLVWTYNKFVQLRNRVSEAWSDIEVQLKRRYDLIPNLVEAVKGYMAHEKNVLQSVTEARTRAMGAQTPAEHGKAENMLAGTLKTLFAVAEQYPDLKANTNFLELQRELSDTENKIQAARRFYNGTVRDLNTAVQSFPGNLIAGMFRFAQREFFDLDEEPTARETPKVKF
ncbi:MAG: LemA protein [Parcubacteria group bacterium Gr01-1014_38]|nr:MAG: LemA protein [Parcubacteria group bacterium Gr01-1014_38]